MAIYYKRDLEKKQDEMESETLTFKRFDPFEWLQSWVDAYEKANKDGKAKDFYEWIGSQPMSE